MSRPSTRKREKKVARQQRARAKVSARRARLREKRDVPPDPSRNLHADRGRSVVVNDITPYARQKCGNCGGRGIVGMRTTDEQQAAEPCKCATVRFFKKHGRDLIVDAQGRAWWPAKPEDYQTVETAGEPVEQRETRPPEPGEKDQP